MSESISENLINQEAECGSNEIAAVSWYSRIINILKCVPKVFFGGFSWEGFALLSIRADISDHAPMFLLLTGLKVLLVMYF
jgi:hypothetical protein